LVERTELTNLYTRRYPEALFVSALEADGARAVRDAVVERLRRLERVYRLDVPAAEAALVAVFHRTGSVLEQSWHDGACRLAVRMREEEWRRLLARHPQIRSLESA
jgi:50S ribosomal subunit-associated GTPase HflX